MGRSEVLISCLHFTPVSSVRSEMIMSVFSCLSLLRVISRDVIIFSHSDITQVRGERCSLWCAGDVREMIRLDCNYQGLPPAYPAPATAKHHKTRRQEVHCSPPPSRLSAVLNATRLKVMRFKDFSFFRLHLNRMS